MNKNLLLTLGVIAALIMGGLYVSAAQATRYHHVTNITNNYTTNEFNDYSTHGITDNDLNSAMAASMAAGNVECSTSSRRHQAGVATGYASGENAFAVGYCHSISDKRAMTLGGKAAIATGMKPVYSIGLNWAW